MELYKLNNILVHVQCYCVYTEKRNFINENPLTKYKHI